MDCPHCRAALPEGAAACPACGVDLVKLKARDLLAKLKKDAAPPASGEPPWLRSALFLGALAVAACLVLYGAALLVGRRAGGAASAPPAAAPAPAPSSEPAAPAAPAPAPQQAELPPPAPAAAGPQAAPVVLWDGTPNSAPPPPPPPVPPR